MRTPVAPYIDTLKPYVPGKPIEETEREYNLKGVIKLASNENPLGPSPKAVEALRSASGSVHLYPDGASFQLTRALADHLGVHPEEVVVGSGSNELIELCIRTFTVADDEVLLCQSSFAAYRICVQSHGRKAVEVPMRDRFHYDLPALAKAVTPRTRLVFLANPDNPTGTAFGRRELERFLAAVPEDLIVVHDEAYFEFVEGEAVSGIEYFRKHPNLISLRTFSKIHGLAGLRVGYGVLDAALAGYLQRTRMPFNVSLPAQAAALAALGDPEHVRRTRENNLAGLRYFEAELTALGLELPKSFANFVLVDLGRPALPVYEQLLRRGIIVRPLASNGFPDALRISVGRPSENARCVAALKELLA